MPTQVASLYGVLSLQDNQFNTSLQGARSGLQGLSGQIRNIGSQMQTVGANITIATAPIAVGIGYAVNQGHQFDRSMSNINSILGITGEEAETLKQQLLQFGAGTVAGPQAVADAYYDIVSGVADATTHMAILNAATRTSEAGQADLKATTSALISTMNSYKLGSEDAQYVSDLFTRTVQTGVLTMDDLASAFPQVTGLAGQLNQPLALMGGSLSYLTTQGYSASQSATYLKAMMTTLLNPTADLETAIHDLGYASGKELLEKNGVVAAYQLLAQQGGGLAGLITNQEALQGALALSSQSALDFIGNYGQGIAGATEKAGAIQDVTAGWDKLRSSMEYAGIQAGEVLGPTISQLIDEHVTPAITEVGNWIQKNPELAKTILLVAGGVVIFGGALTIAGTALTAVTGAITGLIGFALSPLGVALLLGVGLVLAYKNNWLGFRDFIDNTVRPALETLLHLINDINNGINQFIQNVTGANGVQVQAARMVGAPAMITPANPLGAISSLGDIKKIFDFFGYAGRFEREHDYAGMAYAGVPYRIGTQEMFMPMTDGNIVPTGGGGGITITGPITIVADDPRSFAAQLEDLRRRRG